MSLETVRNVRITVIIEGEVAGPDGAILPVSQTRRYGFTDGTGQNQLGAVWQDLDASLATTTQTLDTDALTDFKGAAMSDNNAVKFLCFMNDSDAGDLKVGGGDFSSFLGDATDKIIVKPRGMLLLVAPNQRIEVLERRGHRAQRRPRDARARAPAGRCAGF